MFLRLLAKHPSLLSHQDTQWLTRLDVTELAKRYKERMSQMPEWSENAARLSKLDVSALEGDDESARVKARVLVRSLYSVLEEINLTFWYKGLAEQLPALGFDSVAALGSAAATYRGAWPLETDASIRLLAWPEFDDPTDLIALMTWARQLKNKDVAVCIRHDPDLDGDFEASLRKAQAVMDAHLGPDSPLEMLVVPDPIPFTDIVRLGLSAHATLSLPSAHRVTDRRLFNQLTDLPLIENEAQLLEFLEQAISESSSGVK